jgi:hypothetical protein
MKVNSQDFFIENLNTTYDFISLEASASYLTKGGGGPDFDEPYSATPWTYNL